jgi:hypothetical protein
MRNNGFLRRSKRVTGAVPNFLAEKVVVSFEEETPLHAKNAPELLYSDSLGQRSFAAKADPRLLESESLR